MPPRRDSLGDVGSAVESVIRECGVLAGAQHTLAAQARILARDMDSGVGVAENQSRELRLVVAELIGSRASSVVPPVVAPQAKDAVSKLQDQLAEKRKLRSG